MLKHNGNELIRRVTASMFVHVNMIKDTSYFQAAPDAKLSSVVRIS